MAVMDEFKEERAKMKEEPFQKRWEYFWDYHKTHVIAGIFVFFLAVTFLHDTLTQKDNVFMAAFVDCVSDETKTEAYTQEVMDLMEIDTSKEAIVLDTSFHVSSANTADASATEVLMVRIAAGELDTLLSGETMFGRYALSEIYYDLREVLTPEQLAYYEDSFFYIDNAALQYDLTDTSELDYVDSIDHTTPDGMTDPIPVGIYLNPTEEFQSIYYFTSKEPVVFGIISNAPHIEHAGQFLDHISGRVE